MKLNQIDWGDDSAEKDRFLLNYFVESESFRRLTKKSKSLIIGRKGSGKSAIRRKLEEHFSKEEDTYIVNLSPKYTSIRNILNDQDITKNYGEEIFFQHTWLRQIMLDCLCKVGDDSKGKYIKDSIEFARSISIQLNRTSKDIVENIVEILNKIKVKAGKLGDLGLQLERELRNVADVDSLEFHTKKLSDDGAKFVILIDDLDLGWDNSDTANNLLLGLLSSINYLMALSQNIYCCIFLREDVYSILMNKTQHSDKYRNIERIRWQKDKLLEILNERIQFNRKQNNLSLAEHPFISVFPETVGTHNTINWLIDKTLSRPRELIQFSRFYSETVDDEFPNDQMLKECEYAYSIWKLDDLCSEFSNQYPGLNNIFSYWKTQFFRQKYHLKKEDVDNMLFQVLDDVHFDELWYKQIQSAADTDKLLNILYEIGFIGDFIQGGVGGNKIVYSFNEYHKPRFTEMQIHPCFRKAVSTVDRMKKK